MTAAESSPAPRRILIVAYYYPPLNIVGARRPFALAKHLRRRGHEVTVITSILNGAHGHERDSVLLTRDLLATRLNWRRAAPNPSREGLNVASAGAVSRWASVFVPDVQFLSWLAFAASAAQRRAASGRIDAVITTSPTESTHLVGLRLQRLGIPWIADFRDGWRFEAPRGDFPREFQRRFDSLLERAVVRRANAAVTVSEPLSADLRRRHGVEVETIPNGFDPDEPVATTLPPHIQPAPDRLTLVHTGSFGPEKRIGPVLEGLVRLGAGRRLELILAGEASEAERRLYADPALSGIVRAVGPLDRPHSLALQRAADALLLVTTGRRQGEVTGKLPEYLAAARPVLVLGESSEAARIVTAEEAGYVIPTDDADAVEALLRRLLDRGLPKLAGDAGPRYGYPALAARYAQLVDRVVAASGRTHTSPA